MAPIVLEGSKRRSLTAPAFLALFLGAGLARGIVGARTTAGLVVLLSTIGTLFLLVVGFCAYLWRQPAERLEVRPDRIVLWQGPERGVQLGAVPPIVVQRVFIGRGGNATTTWVLADAGGAAFRFDGQAVTPLDGVLARIDLTSFHPDRVLEALQQAGWPAERRI